MESILPVNWLNEVKINGFMRTISYCFSSEIEFCSWGHKTKRQEESYAITRT